MKTTIQYIFAAILALCSFSEAYGQNTSNRGKDFWVGYMDHIDGDRSNIILYITSDSTTTGVVSVPGQSWSKTFSVTANSMTLVSIPSNITIVECSDCIEKKGIHVTSKSDIVVYSHIYSGARSDATLVLPTKASGKEFYCMGYPQNKNGYYNQFMIVASEDSTKVRITPSEDIMSSSGVKKKDKAYEIMLNEGEIYQGQTIIKGSSLNADVTGTYIQIIDTGKNAKCRNVAVFSGSSFNSVGCAGSADNLYQQMFPISALGKTFVVVPFASRNGDKLKFLAIADKTTVKVNSTTYTLNKGEYKEIAVSQGTPLYITSNNPLLMAQFQKTQACGGAASGDPSMTILTPIEQTLEDIVVYSSSRYNIQRNYINVVIPTKGRSSFTIDGNKVSWNLVTGNTNFSYAQLTVTAGNHRLKASVGFSAIAYGFGTVESYGYVAGANIKKSSFKMEVKNTISLSEIGVCDESIVSFQATADTNIYKSWLWDFDIYGKINYDSTKSVLDDDTSILKDPLHQYPKPGKYNVSLLGFKGENDGCSSYDSIGMLVHIFPNPTAKFSSNGNCLNTGVSFYDSGKIDSGYIIKNTIYNLNDGTYNLNNNFKHYYKDTGKYIVSQILESLDGCRDTFEKRIYVNPIPNVKFTTGQVCYGDEVLFTENSTIDKGSIDSLKWTFNYFDSSNSKNPKYRFNKSGYNYVNLEQISDSGCVNNRDTNILVPDSIYVNFYSKDECLSTAHLFKNGSNAGNSKLDFLWDFGDGSTSISSSPQYKYSDTGTYTIKLIASQDKTCYDSISKSFKVFPAAVPSFMVKDTCFGQQTNLTSSYTIPVGKVVQSKWFINGTSISLDSITNYRFYKSGAHNIGLELLSDNNCISKYFRPITIRENPNPLIAPFRNLDVCIGSTLQFFDSTKAQDSIIYSEWEFGSKVVPGKTITLGMDSLQFAGIKLINTNKFGCKDSTEKHLTVHPLPSLDFTLPTPCKNELFSITNNSSISQGSIVEWYWRNNNKTLSNLQSPKIKINSSNTENIQLIGVSNRLCKDSLELQMSFLESPQASFISDTVCFGLANSFKNTSIFPEGKIDSFSWEFGDYGVSNLSNPSHIYPSPGAYTPRLVAYGDNGCKNTYIGVNYIAEKPFAFFKEDNQNGCVPQTFNYNNLSSFNQDSIYRYEWLVNNTSFSSYINPSYTYNNAGLYSIQLVTINKYGCRDTFIKSNLHNIYPIPEVDFTINPTEIDFLNKDIDLNDNSISKNLTNWLWEINGNIIADWKQISYELEDTGWYTIKMTAADINGCFNSTEKNVYVKPVVKFFMPNAFTPNGNTRNDVFKPEGVFLGLREYEFSVMNRWGEILFTSDNPLIGWDGKVNGETVQNGVYSYQLRYLDGIKEDWQTVIGEVHLIR